MSEVRAQEKAKVAQNAAEVEAERARIAAELAEIEEEERLEAEAAAKAAKEAEKAEGTFFRAALFLVALTASEA